MRFELIFFYTSLVSCALNHFAGNEPGEDGFSEEELLPSKPSKLESNQCSTICNTNPTSANQQGCFCFTPSGQTTAQGISIPNGLNNNQNNRDLPITNINNNNAANNAANNNVATVMVFTTIDPNGKAVPVSSSTILPNQAVPTNQQRWLSALSNHPNMKNLNNGWNTNTYFSSPTNRNYNAISSKSMASAKSAMPSSSGMSKAIASSKVGSTNKSQSGIANSSNVIGLNSGYILLLFISLVTLY